MLFRRLLRLLIFWVSGCALAQNAQPVSSPVHQLPLQIIVVPSESQAEGVLTELKRGTDFGVLAKERSTDPTAYLGGYVGRMDVSSLRPELRTALNGLEAGQFSLVVHTASGFAILKVLPDSAAVAIEKAPRERLSALSSIGSIRYMPNVSGIGEAESTLFQSPKPANWAQDLHLICESRKRTWTKAVAKMEDALSSGKMQNPAEQLQGYYALGELYAYYGKMDRALEQYLKSYEIARTTLPAGIPQAEEELGVAYLHKSEMENNIYSDPGDRCLMPMKPGSSFAKTGDSRAAIEHFQNYLEQNPDDYGVRWLLNLAYMTVGEYPAKVPAKYLLPPSALESTESAPHFTDVAVKAGIKLQSMAGGLIVDDFENNGLLDVVTSSYDMCEHMHYFHNNGDGTFTDRTEKAGLLDQLGGLNMIQADYNNDGCTDILVLRGGWEIPMRKSLLRNNCDGTFTDVTKEAGLAEPATATQTAVWADINNDGWLDLFVGSESGPAQLFLNNGNGTFKNISVSAHISRTAFNKGVVAADYDNDGYVDFYVSNLGGENFLYHNNHNNTFTEVAEQAGVLGPRQGFAAWFFDYDNDGWPDLFVNSYFLSVDESARTFFGAPHNALTMKLYKNMRNGTFRDVTAEAGLDKVFMPMGANFGDIDNDGFLDIYIGNGNPSYSSLVPYRLFRNHDGKYFADVTAASGTGELHKGHGISFADLDRDGDEDILTVTGGAVPGDAHAFRLFENPGDGNDWINLKLVGVKSNRSAIGARIKVTVANYGAERSIYRIVGSGGSFGASPLEQHIGLGKNARIENIDIWWPASNTHQEFKDVAKNQFLEIKELAQNYQKLNRTAVHLGGAPRNQRCREVTLELQDLKAHSPIRLMLVAMALCVCAAAQRQYSATGLVLKVDRAHKSFVASCEAIPNFMEAMVMPFEVRNVRELDGIGPGMSIAFTLVVDKKDSYATALKLVPYEGTQTQPDPLTANRLSLLSRITNPDANATLLSGGDPVPDFALIDQNRRRVTLSEFKGKVVVLNFIYTRCALPNYCFRMSNHFGQLQKRFKDKLGHDLILLTITFDPAHDTPEVLSHYASIWKADAKGWHFLTGDAVDVKRVCNRFGMSFFQDEGLMDHSVHTAVIDRKGDLVANIEGNKFTAQQLGDLVNSVLTGRE